MFDSTRRLMRYGRAVFWHLRHGGPDAALAYYERTPIASRRSFKERKYATLSARIHDFGHKLDSSEKDEADQLKRGHESAEESQKFSNFFSRGYFISSSEHAPLEVRDWERGEVGSFKFWIQPLLPFVTEKFDTENGEISILLMGQVFSFDLRTDDVMVIMRQLGRSVVNAENSWKEFDQIVSKLSGRYVIFAAGSQDARLHVDPTASRSCFWARTEGATYLSSHARLLALATGERATKQKTWILTHPDYKTDFGKWLPALITPYDVAKPVFANCLLEIDADYVQHKRFFPFEELRREKPRAAAERFVEAIRFEMACWTNQVSRPILALTSGQDSKTLLKLSSDLIKHRSGLLFTYHFFKENKDHSRKDLLGANKLSIETRIPQMILDVKRFDHSSKFAEFYKATFSSWARFPSLSQSIYEALSTDDVLIYGIGGEVGTMFYRERSERPISGEVLAGKFTNSEFGRNRQLIDAYEEYINYSDLPSGQTLGYDPYDLFYWENRLSSWAAYGYSELELGPTVGLPFNSRRVLTSMLSVSRSERLRKTIYRLVNGEFEN